MHQIIVENLVKTFRVSESAAGHSSEAQLSHRHIEQRRETFPTKAVSSLCEATVPYRLCQTVGCSPVAALLAAIAYAFGTLAWVYAGVDGTSRCKRCVWGSHRPTPQIPLRAARLEENARFSSPPWIETLSADPLPPYGSRLINPLIANRIHRSFIVKSSRHPNVPIS